jgi:alpha-galactosidase
MKKSWLVFKIVCFFLTSLATAQDFTIEGIGLKIDFELYQQKYLRSKLIYPSDFKHNFNVRTIAAEANLEVALHCTGNNPEAHIGAKLTGGHPGIRLEYVGMEELITPLGKTTVIEQFDPERQLRVHSVYEFFTGTSTIRRHTQITNESDRPVGIEYASSAIVNNFGNLGLGNIEDKLIIHWAYNSWKSEAQWKHSKPSELGWIDNARFLLSGIFRSNLGSQSTIKELPFAYELSFW